MRLAYIQVGGFADGAADAAPSPARCARGRRAKRTPQRANKPKTRNGAPKKNLVAMLRGHKARRTFWEEEPQRSKSGGLPRQAAFKAKFTATRKRGEGAASPLIRSAIAARIFRRPLLSSRRFYPVCFVPFRRAALPLIPPQRSPANRAADVC